MAFSRGSWFLDHVVNRFGAWETTDSSATTSFVFCVVIDATEDDDRRSIASNIGRETLRNIAPFDFVHSGTGLGARNVNGWTKTPLYENSPNLAMLNGNSRFILAELSLFWCI